MLVIFVTSAKVESGKLGTGSRVWSVPRAFQPSTDPPVDRDDVIRTTTALHDFSFIGRQTLLESLTISSEVFTV